MNRRNFLKQVAATTAVGAVAPQVLTKPMQAVFGEDAALTATYYMGVDTAGADESVVSVTTVELPATRACNWWWYDLHRNKWVATKVWQHSEEKRSYDLTVKPDSGEDNPAMMNRANHATFTPATAQPTQSNSV